MLFFMVFLIFCKVTLVTNETAGSAIFNRAKLNSKCWHKDDIEKLKARRSFEEIIPPSVSPESVNIRYIKDTVKYFKNALRSVESKGDPRASEILKEALSDTIGAHLRSEILPTVRFAYYAGYIPFRSAKQIHQLYDDIKIDMNTQGVGWRKPERIPRWANLTVAKVVIGGAAKLADPCTYLITKRDTTSCIHLPSPRLDDRNDPSAIALPLRNMGLVSLTSPKSENILLKYYASAARCILHSSPENCRHADFVNFNNQLWQWMKRDVAPHLLDEKLYAGYSGVLRIAAAVQTYGKGLSRRNLFDEDVVMKKLRSWTSVAQSFICLGTDWTPFVYVGLVALSVLFICLLQFCYTLLFGSACSSKTAKSNALSKEVAYSKVESNFPAVLPQHHSVSYTHNMSRSCSLRPKSQSLGSVTTQKVYDFNDNKEKIMTIIQSDNEDSIDTGTETSKLDSDEEPEEKKSVVAMEMRSVSPPKIEAPMAQLTINKPRSPRPLAKVAVPMYSTSTLTCSNATFCQAAGSESAWSGSSTCTSGSLTSTSYKTRSQRSRSSRELEWARQVLSRHSRGVQSSRTELGDQSFTTQPPRS